MEIRDKVLLVDTCGVIIERLGVETYRVLTPFGSRTVPTTEMTLVTGIRSKQEIIQDISCCYTGLANLTGTRREVRKKMVGINRMLTYLFEEFGQKIPQEEVSQPCAEVA